MNREQAEHILNAYVQMRMRESDKDASDALREVILDAMTGYKTSGGITLTPGITWPSKPLAIPTNWDGTPNVTCYGIDHAYKQATGVGE